VSRSVREPLHNPGVIGDWDMGFISRIQQSVAKKILVRAARSGETVPVVNDHEIHGVSPEMIAWWWDHIESTGRYKLWHPGDHIAFEWITPPDRGHVGAIQLATEKIAGIPMALKIRWEDPKTVKTEFENILAASILSDDGDVVLRFMHEYEAAPYGTKMRSTFHVPKKVPWFVKKGLKKHNIEEMAYFPTFLPELYKRQLTEN